MKRLIIVESPAKIKTIKKFLDSDFKIAATMGHIKDLPTKRMGITRNNNEIQLEYVVIANKNKTIADICKLAKDADEIYLAPDPDREGEIIAWHTAEEIKKVFKHHDKIYRITFNEITKKAVLEAINNKNHIDMEKVAAQQARRVLDRWVGYEVSPILWKKITKGLSAGRVQSVALKLICDREEAIRIFKIEEYWSIIGTFKNNAGLLSASLTHISNKKINIITEQDATKITVEIKKQTFIIHSIEDKNRTKNPLAPFMTSTIQQTAYNALGFSVKKTMDIAQNLYEGISLGDDTPVALITYMRTDSLRISESALAEARTLIKKTFGDKYLPKKIQVYEKKSNTKAQDAHEAIRPIDVNITPDQVKNHASKDQAKLYEIIWQRFIASQMESAQYAQRTVTIIGGNYTFKATGSTLLFDGFLKVYNTEEDPEKEIEENIKIPAGILAQQEMILSKLEPKQHFTQPPARYSEATLVKELEKEGIGRPSTYAAILNTIRARLYTTLEKKRFAPTELGFAVTKLLTINLPSIMDTKFTANMETDLDKIASNELNRDTLLNEFYQKFEKDLTIFRGNAKQAATPTTLDCPECKSHKLIIRFGKTGEFLGCPGFPECTFTSNFKRNENGELKLIEKEPLKTLEIHCPQCNKQLREINGRYGKFIACAGYPECKYVHQNKANFKCPQDNGDIVERAWRGGKFWGCSNYPKCKFALFGNIEETPCPQCKLPALIKKIDTNTNKTILECSDKKCAYKTTNN